MEEKLDRAGQEAFGISASMLAGGSTGASRGLGVHIPPRSRRRGSISRSPPVRWAPSRRSATRSQQWE